MRNRLSAISFVLVFIAAFAFRAVAQEPGYTPPPPPPPAAQSAPPPASSAPPPTVAPQQLDQLVSRIALYPDPLLAQILTASTFPDQIPDADAWAREHAGLHNDALANAIREDNLQWDPSVIALVPFPSVLDMMANDMNWTQQLGDAVLAQRGDVMDAIQRERHRAYQYGYLRSNPYDTVVDSGGYIEVDPVNPAYLYVPVYNPAIVFAAPAPGFFIGGAIRFGPAIVIGGAFAPWGWAHPYFGWGAHAIYFDRTPWVRGWDNRRYYAHPYEHGWVHGPGPRVEHHDLHDHR
jgi:Protein of unknown function (DUF3300)